MIDEITVNRNYEHRLMNYNNDPRTTFADIQQVFDIVERLLSLKLKTDASGTAPAKPSVTKADIEIVRRARQLVDSPAKWDRNPTQECQPAAKTFSLYCALATAITEINGAYDDGESAIREARKLVSESPNAKNYKARLVDFNNDPATTWADVQKILQAVEERLTRQLNAPVK